MLMRMAQGASVLLFCMPGFQLVGSSASFCNGTHWDRPLGNCRETRIGPLTACDFETDDICGWMNDPSNDYEWVRRSGYNTFEHVVSGPSHDHTSGTPLHGFYLVAEQKAASVEAHARLLSPIFGRELSENACIRIFYHMYGVSVGRLRVYVMPEDAAMPTNVTALVAPLTPKFVHRCLVSTMRSDPGRQHLRDRHATRSRQ